MAGTWLVASMLLSPTVALAHPIVDRGLAQLSQAQFQDALHTFDQALAANDLTRHDLVQLFEGRALAHLAVVDAAALDRDVTALAEIDPHHQFGREVPPEVVHAFEQATSHIRGPLAIEVQWTAVPGGVRIEARAVHDAAHLVRALRIHHRTTPSGAFAQTTGGRADVATRDPAGVSAWVEAIGPGGAVVATEASAQAPARPPAAIAGATLGANQGAVEAAHHHGPGLWLWVGIGAGAVAIAALVTVIVLASSSDQARPADPTVVGF